MKTLRTIILLLGTGLIILFLCPLVFIGILNAGNGFGLLFSSIILAYGIFFDKINGKLKNFSQTWAGKIFLAITCVIFIAILIFVVWATVKMGKAADNPPPKETTVVVLGCQVKETGPSRMLRERLDAAYDFLTANPDAKCILSGGKGPDEPVSEAQCMYIYLVTKGIPTNRLYLEDKSTSTEENILFSKEIIEREKLPDTITIITSEFHQYRAAGIAKNLGLESYSVSSNTLITLLPTFYIRELGGILIETLKFN